MQSSGTKAAHRGSRYPSAAKATDMSMLERIQGDVVHDLVNAYREHVEPGVCPQPPAPLGLGLLEDIEEEACSAVRDDRDRQALTMHAVSYVQWALANTLVRNPIILARFGVEMAFSVTCRSCIQYTLGDLWVRRWKWTTRRGLPWLTWSPTSLGERLPLPLSRFDDLCHATDQYGGDVLPADNVVEPFGGLKPTYPWLMDAMRPPVAAVRAAAATIRHNLGDGPLKVLALELGHNIGAQALAVFLDRGTVYTESVVFSHDAVISMPDKYDAVVLNLPAAAAVAFVVRAIRPKPMTRKEIDDFWNWDPCDPCPCTGPLVEEALARVRPGGVLVVMGDVQSGTFHQGAALVRQRGDYREVPVGGQRGPVVFRYGRKVWGVYGSIRPTDRTTTAWRKMV